MLQDPALQPRLPNPRTMDMGRLWERAECIPNLFLKEAGSSPAIYQYEVASTLSGFVPIGWSPHLHDKQAGVSAGRETCGLGSLGSNTSTCSSAESTQWALQSNSPPEP